ncbi:MAG: nicotinate (nicotinamide) nucleotide adenylyltransferase [Oscillospiraceae bacterium]|nr:nicotinate (nicotinamide) nucleotide adenylyltransferase [Oscillospiraceae bacterium]
MERIGIYGGTYNPPHIGHLRAAEYAIEALSLDRLLLIPTGVSPHKEMAAGAGTADRLHMLELSAKGIEKAEVSDIEIRRGGRSYTVDTLRTIKAEHPESELYLLMGTDMFTSFLTWREPEEIMKLATLAVFCRGEKGERVRIEDQKSALESLGARVELVENPVTAISSTDLRRMLVFGCADPFLMPGVDDYIRANGLYGTGKDRKNLSMEELETEVVSLLNRNRVAHVLGCRDCAIELARLYGENETDAARAGLLHDITKAIDGPLQLTLCAEYGMILDTFSRSFPKTLHALTGSLVARRIFGENENVVSAICHHTTGRANMTLLEKIIYIADYVERNRNFPGVEEMRRLAYTDLDAAVLMGLESAVAHVKRQGQELAPATLEALAYLKNQCN